MRRPKSPRRWRRWPIAIGLVVIILLGATFATLRLGFEGEALGSNIASRLNKRMRGRIEIGSIEWPTSAIKTAITGGWVPVTARDVSVWDDCALSASTQGLTTLEADELRSGDPNEDCTPDDQPDPDPTSKRKPRKLLLRTDLITADIDIHALMFGNHDLVFRNVWVYGGEALLDQTREPYPMHAYDRTIVSIVTAFYPRMRPGFRAGIYADVPPPIFDLRDIHVKGLTIMVHTAPYSLSGDRVGYGMAARLDGVDVDADPDHPKNDSYLYMDPTDPLIAKFYVRLNVTAQHANVRILDEGPRPAFRLTEPFPTQIAVGTGVNKREAMYTLELKDIELKRLAQLPTEWTRRDNVAKTIEIDATAKAIPCDRRGEEDPELAADGDPTNAAKRASLHFFGEIQGYWDRPYDGQWNFALDAENLGPAIRSCIKKKIHGENLAGRITLTGPFVALPKVGLDLKGMDFDIPLRKSEEPLRLTLAEVHGWLDLVNDQGAIEKTKALVRGGKEPGEVEVSALFAIRPYTANASVEIIKPIDVARFLPRDALPIGHFVSGRLRANGDVERGFALDEFDLWLGASATDKALRMRKGQIFTNDDFDTIRIQGVNVDAGRNHATFRGSVSTVTEDIDLTIDGDFPDLDMWLKRFNLPPLFKSAGVGQVHVTGKYTKPRVDVNTELGGVPCLDKVRLEVIKEGDTLDIKRIASAGLGGELTGSGLVRLGAVPTIEKLHLAGKGISAAKVCGLGGVAKGTIDAVELDVHGSIDKSRSVMDWLDLTKNVSLRADKLAIYGDGYSNVRMCINRASRKDDATCRPSTAYLDSDDLAQCDDAKQNGGFCAVATARRDAGGKLDATIAKIPKTFRKPAHLGGTIRIEDLPMAVINGLVGKPVTGGLFSSTFHLSGPPLQPQAEGNIQLLRAWAFGGFLGDPQLAVEPGTINGISGLKITGKALADRITITGVIGTAAPYPVEVQLSGRRIELDQFVDVTAMVGSPDPIQAWVSGKVTLKTELAPLDGKPAVPDAWIELSELVAIIDHRATDGRQTPLRLSVIDESPATRAAVSLHVTPTSYELACRDPQTPGKTVPCATKVATPAGVIVVAGRANPSEVAITADTTPDHPLELALLASLLDHQFDEVSGHLQLHASLAGTLAKPNRIVELDIDPANGLRLRPIGQDVVLRATSGQIRYANGSLGFNDVQVSIDDPNRKDEQGLLTIHGGIALDGLNPVSWGVLVEGQIAGKMLLVVAPGLVASASGIASIGPDGLQLIGRGAQPQLAGTLVFDPPPVAKGKRPVSPIAMIPRGTNRELSFIRGTVDVRTCGPQNQDRDDDGLPRCPALSGDHRAYLLDVNDVDISVGGEGHIKVAEARTGKITVRDGSPWKGHITLDAESVPYRRQRELDLVINASDVSLELVNEQSPWHVTGEIAIVNGTYKRNFELTDRLTALASNAPPSKPFWEEYPTVGGARLDDIQLNVNRFAVENNIASIELAGDKIAINGTPREPKLSGTIRVERGEFRLPGTRANFTRTSGSIRFDANVKADNPFIDLTTEADYRDLSGQDHLITLSINGPLAQPPTWDLKTSTGYNKSQTLALLVLGRNPEQLRRSLGDQSLGSNPISVDPSTNPSQGITDQLVKDVAGDWVSGLLGSSLTKLLPVDVLRIEVGLGSVGVRVEKKVLENVKLIGDQEWTIRGNTTNGRVELRTPWKIITTTDKISFQGAYLSKNFYDPAETDIQDYQAKLVYKLFIP